MLYENGEGVEKDVVKAIQEANLGINPTDNGECVILTIPALTEERRREYVKQAKQIAEDAKVALRKVRQEANEDIKKIGDTVAAFQDGTLENVAGFCAVADLQEIAKQDFILTPGRYVGIEEQEDDGEPFEEKMTRLTGELSELFAQSHALEEEIRQKLGAIGYGI